MSQYMGCVDSGGCQFWREKTRTLRGTSLNSPLDKLLELMDKI